MPLPAGVTLAAALGPSLIQGISGFIGQKKTHEQSRWNNMQTIKANRELADLAYKRDIDMWERMKSYNTPAMQMKRFKEAGLNPHLIYGQGSPGNVQSAPSYTAPRVDYDIEPDNSVAAAGQGLAGFQESILLGKQIEGKSISNAMEDWSRGIRELEHAEAWRANQRQSLFQGDWMQQGGAELQWKSYVGKMTEDERRSAGVALKNKYQQELNKLIEKGITPGDSWKLRIGLFMLESLGVNVEGLLRQLDGVIE